MPVPVAVGKIALFDLEAVANGCAAEPPVAEHGIVKVSVITVDAQLDMVIGVLYTESSEHSPGMSTGKVHVNVVVYAVCAHMGRVQGTVTVVVRVE